MADIVKTDPTKRLVYGWAYIAKTADGEQVVDASGDFIDRPEELEKAATDFVLHSRNGDADHGAVPTATLVESLFIDKAKAEAMGLDCPVPEAWWVGFRVDNDEVWERVAKGELTSFSIGGTGIRHEFTEDADA